MIFYNVRQIVLLMLQCLTNSILLMPRRYIALSLHGTIAHLTHDLLTDSHFFYLIPQLE